MAKRYDDDDADDDDLPSVKKKEPLSGLDAMYANTNMVVLVLFAVCCSGIAAILSLVALLTCKDAKAKANATTTLIIAAIVTVLGVALRIVGAILQTQ